MFCPPMVSQPLPLIIPSTIIYSPSQALQFSPKLAAWTLTSWLPPNLNSLPCRKQELFTFLPLPGCLLFIWSRRRTVVGDLVAINGGETPSLYLIATLFQRLFILPRVLRDQQFSPNLTFRKVIIRSLWLQKTSRRPPHHPLWDVYIFGHAFWVEEHR